MKTKNLFKTGGIRIQLRIYDNNNIKSYIGTEINKRFKSDHLLTHDGYVL